MSEKNLVEPDIYDAVAEARQKAAQNRDLVQEVRGLLTTHSIVAMRVDRPYQEIRELLSALCDEVERLRNQWNTRFNTFCGNCGKRYLGPRDEHLHGIGICGGINDGE